MDPRFLALDEVLALHSDQVLRYGGAQGLRDPGLLSSAIAMPQASYGGAFLHPTLFEMAAAYLFHLTQNHAFVDGNKRIGLAAALVFLHLNGQAVEAPDDDLFSLVLRVAKGAASKAEVAVFLESHAGPIE